MIARLQQMNAAEDVLEIQVDRLPFVIGRGNDCDCSLLLASISRRHCVLSADHDQLMVQDLGSQNGTYANGQRAQTPLPLRHGDELCLGSILFRVLMEVGGKETHPSIAVPRPTDRA